MEGGRSTNLIDRANDLRYLFFIIRYGQQIMALAIGRASYQPRDVLFVLLLVACLLLSAAAVFSGLETRQAALVQGGARKVDAAKVRKQILDGHLSPRKAFFYRRLPR